MTEILPCPFCGASASVEELEGNAMGDIRFSVGCDSWQEETCMGYQSLTTFATRTEAVAAWNKRTELREETHQISVSEPE